MRSSYLVASLLFLVTLPSGSAVQAGPLKAGAATADITPELGLPIVGGFVPSPSTNIHDPLRARCLVVDDGTTKVALVVCDLLGIAYQVSTAARDLIKEKTGIPAENVLISATHTHSGSSASGSGAELDNYQKFVVRRIADGVACANNNLRPAEIAFGAAEAPEHVFNRRWFMKPGTVPENPFGTVDKVKMNPPSGSPNLTEPAGPTDPTVSFIYFREPGGAPIGLYAAYSLHYVGGVKGGDISADYFAMFCEELTYLLGVERQDPPFVPMMANGTSGDINNINFVTPRGSRKPYEQMRYVADDVARRVHAALANLTFKNELTLAVRYREPLIGYRKPTEQQNIWADETIARGRKSPGDLSFIYAERTKRLLDNPDAAPLPVHLIRLGDIAVGTMPCEVFCEIGLEFKRRSPIRHSFMVSLGHGYFGYLPTPRHFELGGYETWIGTNRLEPQASDKLLANLLEMADEVK